MRVTCPNCGAEYDVPEGLIPPAGKHVQCTACHTRWFMHGEAREALSEEQILRKLETRSVRPVPGAGTGGAEPIPFPGAAAARPAPPRPAEPVARPEPGGEADGPDESPASVPEPEAPEERAREPEPETAEPEAAAPPDLPPEEEAPLSEARPRIVAPRPEPAAEPAAPAVPEAGEPRIALREAPRVPPRIEVAAAHAEPPAPVKPKRRFLPGFILALLVAGLALEIYVWRDPLAEQIPAAAPALGSYGDAVDGAREWLRDRFEGASGKQPG
ncbi:zinc-ribbon domain-containing protein [Amaricoccus solimangrovi]|uniref:Zinc finger/thioredoxin putative domain-containing protein n=1 Tax=Amaricoccus solimangrovi TaxID=2589815 RepID=A0A501WRW3_9RHOB|nr:zinc-ribbon domain-containing protein [Amaricoccus solimangrovi]TPE52483.1 hypothetical protein FJM51_04700 [Amaricoccus solimangrovi]